MELSFVETQGGAPDDISERGHAFTFARHLVTLPTVRGIDVTK